VCHLTLCRLTAPGRPLTRHPRLATTLLLLSLSRNRTAWSGGAGATQTVPEHSTMPQSTKEWLRYSDTNDKPLTRRFPSDDGSVASSTE
jgi:hypothetical protein